MYMVFMVRRRRRRTIISMMKSSFLPRHQRHPHALCMPPLYPSSLPLLHCLHPLCQAAVQLAHCHLNLNLSFKLNLSLNLNLHLLPKLLAKLLVVQPSCSNRMRQSGQDKQRCKRHRIGCCKNKRWIFNNKPSPSTINICHAMLPTRSTYPTRSLMCYTRKFARFENGKW